MRVLLVGDKRINADWAGRMVIVAAFLYYMLDESGMSDAQYDRMSNFCADYWDEMNWERQWAMKDPDTLRASGAHFRFTTLAACASLNRFKYITGQSLAWHPDMEWKHRKRDGCRYITLSAIKPVPISGERYGGTVALQPPAKRQRVRISCK